MGNYGYLQFYTYNDTIIIIYIAIKTTIAYCSSIHYGF